MNPSGSEPFRPVERPWSPLRRWTFIALVFGAQIGLIFAFGERKPAAVRQPTRLLQLRLGNSVESPWQALDNPALFALPSREGFSGAAWLHQPDIGLHPFAWREPARWLPLPTADLGTALTQFTATNAQPALVLESKPAPKINLPKPAPEEIEPSTHSILRIDGDLAQRRMLYPPDLPGWPASDLLADSVVQVLVDRAGNVLSTALLASSTSKDVDQWALNLARSVQFAPLPKDVSPGSHWTPGTLVFQWQTVPLPATNAPADAP